MIPSTELINKYNVSGPRYTSYPTAIDFTAGSGEAWRLKCVLEALDRKFPSEQISVRLAGKVKNVHSFLMNGDSSRPYSLYIHIPFCYSLCWYCGCTKVITRDPDRGDAYLDDLEKEMRIYGDRVNHSIPVKQIHFGGGTPTFLTPEQLLRLGSMIGRYFQLARDVEFSVEIDPRRCDRERIDALRKIGCNRASLGVQDTNRDVQEAIHRIQPFEETEQVTEWLRDEEIGGINFDLIYGLPRQTATTFARTLDQVMSLDPDRIALYSYAHLPDRLPSQRLLDETELPSPDEKLAMFTTAVHKLTDEEMSWIGMDHFAKKSDDLAIALENGTLQRNFQGYSTHAETDLIGLGMSGISQFNSIYYQNYKTLDEYEKALEKGNLPVARILPLDTEDRIRRDMIMQLMCRRRVPFTDFMEKWGLDPAVYFSKELYQLKPLETDGLVRIEPDGIEITETGRFFLRNIAMIFDSRLPSVSLGRFSKTV